MKKTVLFLFYLSIFAGSFIAHAEQVNLNSDPDIQICRQIPSLNELWKKTYIPKLKIHGAGLGPVNCNKIDKNLKLATALYLIDQVDKDLKDTYMNYISSKAIGGVNVLTAVQEEGIASADPESRSIDLSEKYYEQNMYDRAATIIHEVKHLDDPTKVQGNKHVICNFIKNRFDLNKNGISFFEKEQNDFINSQIRMAQEKFDGNKNYPQHCDPAFYDKGTTGSYSVQIIFLRRLYDKQNWDIEVDKSFILERIIGMFWTRFSNVSSDLYNLYTNSQLNVTGQGTLSHSSH